VRRELRGLRACCDTRPLTISDMSLSISHLVRQTDFAAGSPL
jgi:hypothetical protein